MSTDATASARSGATTDSGRRVAVVGSGYMGGGIAQVLALSGAQVTLADVSAKVSRENHARLLTEAAAFVRDGLFPEDAVVRLEGHLSAAESIEAAVEGCEFVMEAVPERLELKHPVLERISRANSSAVIASNTSTISIGRLAEKVEQRQRFLGVHFSNPAPFIPGVEIIPHAATAEAAITLAETIVHEVGKQPARIVDKTGFVLNRLQYALFAEATRVVEEGVASAEDVDTIVRTTFGFRLPFFGPFVIADMAGLDVYAGCYDSLQQDYPDRFAPPGMLTELVDQGKLGTKTGSGFLDLPTDRVPELIAYRNRAYVKMQQLLDELGPAPVQADPEAPTD